jgi:nitrite reductase/ring-hydroxylating ferredoxin subunit
MASVMEETNVEERGASEGERARSSDLRASIPALGLRNYWYPAMFAGKLGRRPKAVQLLGEEIVFHRAHGGVHAVQGRCPHRGARLDQAHCLAEGVLTCPYHGFSFDVTNGKCVAALSEGPDSEAPRRLELRTYPAQEKYGVIWVFIGEVAAHALEEDLPEAFSQPQATVVGRRWVWRTNWRVALDNGVDTAHPAVLHRAHPFFRFRQMPSFAKPRPRREGKWLYAQIEDVDCGSAQFPGVGKWPRDLSLRKPGKGVLTGIRLPGVVRIGYSDGTDHFRWAVPIDEKTSVTFQFLVKQASGLGALWFRLYYYFFKTFVYHIWFQWDDKKILETLDRLMPETLTQSDAVIIQWRRMARDAGRSRPSDTRTS